jgi:hypothetical protein
MTTDAKTIIDQASILLSDTDAVHWSLDELLSWLNAGQLELVALAPLANTKNTPVQLVAGVKQSLPVGGISLVDIPYNMGSGSTIGATINLVPKEVMLKRLPGWTIATPNSVVKHYIYTPSEPLTFYVYPPQTSSPSYVQLVYSAVPTPIANASIGTKITVPDHYTNALLDYILYRALSKDSEYGNQDPKAQLHYQAFVKLLSVELSAEQPKQVTK